MSEADLISDVTSLGDLEGRWRELAERLGNAFVSPEWFFAWWRHYGEAFDPAVVVGRTDGDRVEGLLPLVIARTGRPRAVRFAGSNLGDHFEPVDGANVTALVAGAAASLHAIRPAWSAIVLDNVDAGEGGKWWREVAAVFPGRLRVMERGRSALPYIPIAGLTWEGYLERRSASFRKRLRQIERGLDRVARVRLRRTSDTSELERDLETFFALHYGRWEGRGGSALASPRARAFHEDFAAAALERGWLRLWFLEADGEPIAAWYGWRLGGRYAFYQGGFDPDWARHSVGFYIVARVIERAIDEGAAEFNMLLGTESYKARFAEASRPVRTVVMTRALHPATALVGAEIGARRLARRIAGGSDSRLRRRLVSLAGRLPTAPRR